jgi:GNAT superfamily N-acetyltransferase
MIRISRMSISDISFAVKLSAQEEWGTPRSDLARILRLDPHGSFVASEASLRVGMLTTVRFGRELAWIGNVIVNKNHRGKHIGQCLVRHAVDYLKRIHVKHIGLYCFRHNVEFYKTLGFVADAQFVRLRRPRGHSEQVERASGKRLTLDRLLSVDRRAFGADRSKLIRSWITERAGKYFGCEDRRMSAFLLVKKYGTTFDFGPGVAFGVSDDDLRKLLAESVEHAWNKPIEVSCLAQNRSMLRALSEFGFRTTNRGYRMFWNHSAKLGLDRANILLGFLDKG